MQLLTQKRLKISNNLFNKILSFYTIFYEKGHRNQKQRTNIAQPYGNYYTWPFSFQALSYISTAMASEEGIDVSRHDGEIDWVKVKATGIKFGIVQATEGSGFEDPNFVKNWQGMKLNQIKPSAFHYLIGNQTAASQVKKINEVLKKSDFNGNNDIFAISVQVRDNENSTADEMADVLHGVISELKTSMKKIYIHTGPYFWKHRVSWKKYDFSSYGLWIAHFSGEQFLRIPDTWKDKGYRWWQYSLFGVVEGIKGSVSRNKSNGTLTA